MLEPGSPAPAFTLPDQDGRPVSRSGPSVETHLRRARFAADDLAALRSRVLSRGST